MIYKYPKTRKAAKWPSSSIPYERPDEGLTGFVQGQPASDLEERFARAIETLGLPYIFQFYVEVVTSISGQGKQVDFVVYAPLPSPVEVDGEFAHKSSEQRSYDVIRDALIDEALTPYGYDRIKRIKGDDLITQDTADMTAKELFG